jgi:RHS repeat-associated protein
MRYGSGTIYYLLGDHLGSTAITTNSSGVKTAEKRYYPWGTERYTYGAAVTTYQFTGQRLESGIGLYFYNARWYDPAAGRFISADTLIPDPGDSQAWDRYAYTLNNPLRYTDPNGHNYCESRWADPSDCAEAGAVNGHVPPVENPQEEEQGPALTWTGTRMNELYWELYRMSGNKFSLEDFITLILQRELASWWNDMLSFFKKPSTLVLYELGHSSQNALIIGLEQDVFSR